MLERLNLRHLVFFRTLAETSNFTEAARRCGISQPGLSVAIKDLETELGVVLFHRDTRNVVLSESGAEILPLVRATLTNSERAVAEIRLAARMGASPLRVAAVSSLASYLLPQVLLDLEAGRQDAAVEILDVPSGQDFLLEGRADLGIGVGPFDTRRFDTDYLFEDPLSLVLRRDHSLAHRDRIRWSELAPEPVVVYRPDTENYRTVRHAFAVHGIHFEPKCTFHYRQSIFGMVLANCAVAILPGLSLDKTMPPGLVHIPLADPEIIRRYFVFNLRGHALTHDAQETKLRLKTLLQRAWHLAKPKVTDRRQTRSSRYR